jgi:hypothetical protein
MEGLFVLGLVWDVGDFRAKALLDFVDPTMTTFCGMFLTGGIVVRSSTPWVLLG